MQDVLSDAFFEARKAELKDRVCNYRFTHVCGVAQCAQELAVIYGVDPYKARLAGVLHDWDKAMNDVEIRARVEELGMKVDSFLLNHLPRIMHAHTAAVALAREFPEIPQDVIQAIDRHTVAACDMSELDMVIYCADALEPSRSAQQIKDLRAKIGTLSLEELFLEVYEFWVANMLEKHLVLHPDTVTIWNYYSIRNCRQKGDEPCMKKK